MPLKLLTARSPRVAAPERAPAQSSRASLQCKLPAMCRAVVVILLVLEWKIASAAPPLRLTIDCSGDVEPPFSSRSAHRNTPRFDVNSFCSLIHSAIPKAVKDGKFILTEDPDQTGYSDTQVPFSVPPPKGFIPKFGPRRLKAPRVKIPKIKVPKLRKFDGKFSPPRIGSSSLPSFRDSPLEEESSAERMEKFKKGVQKMLHVVKVLGQIDQYLSERTRIIVEKLSKTFSD